MTGNETQAVLWALRDVYTAQGVRVWLEGRNKLLGGRRPIDLITEGRGAEVLALARSLEQMTAT